MKKSFYILLLSLVFFVYLVLFNDHLNPVGAALQIWISLIFVLVMPLLLRVGLGIRIAIFIPLAILFSFVGMSWAGYSDLGGLIFPFYCFFILIAVIISHFILQKIDSANTPTVVSILSVLILAVFIFGVFAVQNGVTKYNQLVEQFKNKCATTGSIYGHCDDPNYMKFFPPNNHITF